MKNFFILIFFLGHFNLALDKKSDESKLLYLPSEIWKAIINYCKADIYFLNKASKKFFDHTTFGLVLNKKIFKEDLSLAFEKIKMRYPNLLFLELSEARGENLIDLLSKFTMLKNVTLRYGDNAKVSDLIALSRLTKLQVLELFDCSNDGFKYFSHSINISELHLTDCEVIMGDKSFIHLSNLINLKTLNMKNSYFVKDDDLKYLSNLTTIENLCFKKFFELTNNGLKYISGLTKIKNLDLSYCRYIKCDNILYASNLTNLKKLNLKKTKAEKGDFSYLKNLKNLNELNLSGSIYIDDYIVKSFNYLTNLTIIR